MTYTLSYSELKALDPCDLEAAAALFGGAEAWGDQRFNLRQAREAGLSLTNAIWLAGKIAKTDKEAERLLRLFACDCAERVLHIFEDKYPGDKRPRIAIETARRFANGEASESELSPTRTAWNAARAAAWAAAWAAARAAARAAAQDAAWAAGAAWAVAQDAAWAAGAAGAAGYAWDARDAEHQWQYDRLCHYFCEEKKA